jgi:hypothetical protein
MSRGYILPLSRSPFPLPNTSFSLSPHPYPERRSSGSSIPTVDAVEKDERNYGGLL